jgi:hypothetical protein
MARALAARMLRIALALAVSAALPAAAQAQAQAPEAQVKAAFLYNFARFVDWPQARRGGSVVSLCLLGAEPFGGYADALNGRPVGAGTLTVRRIARPPDAAACDMVFLPNAEAARLPALLDAARGRRLLTVGETPGAAAGGLVINFYLEQNRVRFEINIDAAQRTGLSINSQLLRLARITHDRTQGDE